RIWVELNYRWNWSVIPQYLFRYDPEKGSFVPNVLIKGFFTTLKLSIWATVLATALGTVMALLRLSRSLFGRMIGRTYVELIRNMPPLVLVFILYFFISDQILAFLGIDNLMKSLSPFAQRFLTCCFSTPAQFPVFASGLITLVLYEGAYITEIIRAGILSIDQGQWEASSAMGLSKWQQMRHVIFPQATLRILPPLAGQLISTIKDSAIVSVISIQELTFRGMELMAATYLTFEVWITITALYFIVTFSLSLGVRRLEVSMRRY
ncbi:MAG: amino acid ABC transporter permease, partial [Deltaproteobacteria bacterium]|nr:amino acid ABC transporter permease [Deltaproteobacteria bacterium]